MTHKMTTLFAAAVLTGITTATAVFAAERTPVSLPTLTQGEMAQMNPEQMKQMATMPASRSNTPAGPDEEHPHFKPSHFNPTR